MLREQRKRDHIAGALSGIQVNQSGFDDVHFVHQSLPNSSLSRCELETTLGGLKLSSPFLVNAMTGGAPEAFEINRDLARAAAVSGMSLAVGSQRNAILNPELISTYQVVRDENPSGIIFANLGAGASVSDAYTAVEMLQANALQLHLNVPQELAMPEGDRCFVGILEKIQEVVNQLHVPVIVKEVGFGMSYETISLLTQAGVSAIDVAGKGGTNFIQIENLRSNHKVLGLETWGQTTVISLLEAGILPSGPDLMGSGGVHTPLQAAKCFALGAKAVGVSGHWLHVWKEEGLEGLLYHMNEWHDQLKIIMTLLGASQPEELAQSPIVITGFTAEWCKARGILISDYARR